MAQYETLATIVSDASVELGLGAVSNPIASTDANVVQMLALLKRLGRRLALHRNWLQLRKVWGLDTTPATGVVVSGTELVCSLPSDWLEMVDQSGWNRTTKQPIAPLNPQQWQAANASGVSGLLVATFRPLTATVSFYPVPTSGDRIYVEYRSRWWVAATAGSISLSGKLPTHVATADSATVNTDVLLFEPSLLVCGLKLEFLRAKGFDSTAAEQDYSEALRLAESADGQGAPVLSIGGGSLGVGGANTPETGFGA